MDDPLFAFNPRGPEQKLGSRMSLLKVEIKQNIQLQD